MGVQPIGWCSGTSGVCILKRSRSIDKNFGAAHRWPLRCTCTDPRIFKVVLGTLLYSLHFVRPWTTAEYLAYAWRTLHKHPSTLRYFRLELSLLHSAVVLIPPSDQRASRPSQSAPSLLSSVFAVVKAIRSRSPTDTMVY